MTAVPSLASIVHIVFTVTVIYLTNLQLNTLSRLFQTVGGLIQTKVRQ